MIPPLCFCKSQWSLRKFFLPLFKKGKCYVPSSNVVALWPCGDAKLAEHVIWLEENIEGSQMWVPLCSADGGHGWKKVQLNHTGLSIFDGLAHPCMSPASMYRACSKPGSSLDDCTEVLRACVVFFRGTRSWKLRRKAFCVFQFSTALWTAELQG